MKLDADVPFPRLIMPSRLKQGYLLRTPPLMPTKRVNGYANVTACTEDGVSAVKVIKFIDLFVDISQGRRGAAVGRNEYETAIITCIIGDGVRFTAK